jgi:hypothetical protein
MHFIQWNIWIENLINLRLDNDPFDHMNKHLNWMKNKFFPIYEIGIFLGPLSAHFISTTTKKGEHLPISSWHNQFKQTKNLYTLCAF